MPDRFRAFSPAGPVPAPPPGHTWQSLMELALKEAQAARLADEVPVGAVIADARGRVLAKAANAVERSADPTAHAEILAVRQACARLNTPRLLDCVLIVTLEPCLMCAGAIMQARLAGIVFAAADDLRGAIISTADCLDLPRTPARVWHMGGVLSRPAARLLHEFFLEKR